MKTKFFSLLKAAMSQDMQIFRIKKKVNDSITSKALIPIVLSILVMFSIGCIYAPLAIELDKIELTFIILEVSIAAPSILAVMEGIYKSQSILFEAKDTDLLFSLPISKKMVLAVRLIKLYAFQFLYSMLFVIPGIAIYCYLERPGVYFYLITLITIILFPIIPTVIGCVIGFITKRISVMFKAKKIIQTIITFAILLVFISFSYNSTGIVNSILENAEAVDNALRTYYFPIGGYIDLIFGFDAIKLILLILINVAFVYLFVNLASINYFKITSKSKENYKSSTTSKANVDALNYKQSSQFEALLKKEFNRYFSSTTYVVNTLFGLVLLLIATIGLCSNFDATIEYITEKELDPQALSVIYAFAPKGFLAAVIGMSFLTSITSSSISLEGKSFNILKALPVSEDKILLAKIMMSNIITIPVIFVCDIIFLNSFDVSILDAVLIILASILAPSIAATFGLLVNLKYPKMDASSDTEVVKQSTSSMVAVLGGILFAGIFIGITVMLTILGESALIFEVILLAIILFALWMALRKYGKRRLREIEA